VEIKDYCIFICPIFHLRYDSVMEKQKLAIIILAAGKGTRMRSLLPKVLHKLNGQPLLSYPLRLAKGLNADPIIVVVGYQAEQIRNFCQGCNLHFALQQPQIGTGHAVMQAVFYLQNFIGPVLILSGDVPGLRLPTIQTLLHTHQQQGNALTVMTMRPQDPAGYGRVLINGDRLLRIVEVRDATPSEKQIPLVNAGIYLAQAPDLLNALPALAANNAQQEYYLTDLVEIMNNLGLQVGHVFCANPLEAMGVNSPEELSALEKLLSEAT
jgi:UDP-N-acetylglucosamine diphosphorylase/glucosamine-1-phosphate N-acetyltransferase